MELDEIRQIVELMKEHDLSLFHLKKEDFTIELKKGPDIEQIAAAMQAQMPVVHAAPSAPAGGPAAQAAAAGAPPVQENDENLIKSPMVGTFYRSASPDSEPFIEVGMEVDENTTICIIEAMKVMNEIKAERRGRISSILIDDAQPVQYGEGLFKIDPS